jgi:hypothetical protein
MSPSTTTTASVSAGKAARPVRSDEAMPLSCSGLCANSMSSPARLAATASACEAGDGDHGHAREASAAFAARRTMGTPATSLQQLVGAGHAPAAAGRQHQRGDAAAGGDSRRRGLDRVRVFLGLGRAADQAADAHRLDLARAHRQPGQQALQHPVEAVECAASARSRAG